MRDLYAVNNFRKISITAHSIKSAAQSIGAMQAGDAFLKIEKTAQERPDTIPELLTQAEQAFAEARHSLLACLEEPAAQAAMH